MRKCTTFAQWRNLFPIFTLCNHSFFQLKLIFTCSFQVTCKHMYMYMHMTACFIKYKVFMTETAKERPKCLVGIYFYMVFVGQKWCNFLDPGTWSNTSTYTYMYVHYTRTYMYMYIHIIHNFYSAASMSRNVYIYIHVHVHVDIYTCKYCRMGLNA